MSAALQPIPQASPGFYPGLGRIYRDSVFDIILVALFDATGINTVEPSYAVQNDGHFVCIEATYTNSLVLAAAGALPPTVVQGGAFFRIQDGRTTKYLSNAQLPVDSKFGTGREPYVWPFPHVFAANSAIMIQVTGATAAMANQTIRLILSGYKVPLGTAPWEQGQG